MEENYNNNNNNNETQYNYNTDYNYTPTQNYDQQDNEVMSVGEWFLTILATIVPCVGLVLYLVWAFGSNGSQNRKNYCRAWLIYYVIQMVLAIILIVLFSVFIGSTMFGEFNNYYY